MYGFDISQASVDITTSLLSEYGLKESRFKKADIMNTGYSSELFDAVTARAVLDHLNAEDFKKALSELQRITRKNGLIYASFDPLEDEDLILEHKTLADGSLLYTDASREGLLFHYYTDDELQDIFRDYSVLMFTKDNRGNRHIVFQVEK